MDPVDRIATLDCRGAPIRPLQAGCGPGPDRGTEVPVPIPIDGSSVVVARADGPWRAAWVRTHRFRNGDLLGPVGLAERTPQGVAVWAIGALRLPPWRPRLRLHRTVGRAILEVRAERCEARPSGDGRGGGGRGCARTARLLPLVDGRLDAAPLRAADGSCLGPARIDIARERSVELASGWRRRFRLAASVEVRRGQVIITERVTAEDFDPEDPGRPPRRVRTSEDERVLTIEPGGGLRSSARPLLERVMQARGSTRVTSDLRAGSSPRP
ncbi:MAG: hypothetical protein ACFCGT_21480 [Sandaracinaceae bacterium]